MQRKIFYAIWALLGVLTDFRVSLLWSLLLTAPEGVLAWWIAYRSGWFE